MLNKIKTILLTKYEKELVDKIVDLYGSILFEYRKKSWKNCISNIALFNEACFRVIEYELTGNYIPLSSQLPKFNGTILNKWENTTGALSEFRVIIPRILYGMYCLRSKRGAVHLSNMDANEMDATLLLNQSKWLLAEFVRLSSNLSFEETTKLIKQIICKEHEMVWDTGSNIRVLLVNLKASEKALCNLYFKDCQTEKELFENVEYSSFSLFKSRILKSLHSNRLIEYKDKICKISPLGIMEAEKVLKSFNCKKM